MQRGVVDGQSNECRNVILGVLHETVLCPLLLILCTPDMWYRLENMLAPYDGDDATLFTCISSQSTRSVVTEFLNRDLRKFSTWCKLSGIRLNPNKTQNMVYH